MSVPNNFVVVTEYLIKLISENFDDENKDKRQELLFDAIIGGECIIFKNSKNDNIHFISLYDQNNNFYNYNNNVDFIFIYFNKDEIEKRINFIMVNTISNFFVSNGINKENKNVQMIKDNENKLIVQIISNKYFNPSETFYMLYNENMLNLANPNTYNIYKLKPILICLYQFKNLMEELDKYSNNKNIITKLFVEFLHNFNNIDEITIKFQNHFKDILEKQNYKDIISEIIDKLNLELSDNKKNINKQIEEITEEAAKEKFIKEHQNPSIIEKLFFIQILREKNRNNIKTYICDNQKFLLIDLDKEEKKVKLSEKLFNLNSIKIKKKILYFPKILVVLFEGKKIDNFHLKDNFIICKNRIFIYNLKSFIERETNFIFYKRNDIWYRNDYNREEKFTNMDNINNIKPIVLFYALLDQNINDNNIYTEENKNNMNKEKYINNQKSVNEKNIINYNSFNGKNINNQNLNNMNPIIINKNFNMNNNFNNMNLSNNMNMANNMNFNNNMNMPNNMNFNNMFNNMNFNNMNNNMNISNNMNNKKNMINNMNYNMSNNFNMFNMNNNINIINNNSINNNQNMNLINNNNNMNNINNLNNNNMNNLNFMQNINNMNMNNNFNIINNLNNNMNNLNMNNNNINMNSFNNNNINMNNMNNNFNNNMFNMANFNNIGNNMILNQNNNSKNYGSAQNNNGNIISNNNNSGNNKTYAKKDDKNIFLTFTFSKNHKQIFIDVNENDIFENVIRELEEKYSWLQTFQYKTYFLDNKEIKKEDFSKTVKNLKIVDNSNIVIIVEEK